MGGSVFVHRAVVEDLVVDLVGEHEQPVAAGQFEQTVDRLA